MSSSFKPGNKQLRKAAKAGTEFKVPMPQIPPELKNQPAVPDSLPQELLWKLLQGNS
jgi:hypothetical protein